MTDLPVFQPVGGPLPASSAWHNYGPYVGWTGGVVVGNPTLGNTGAGTINAENLYINGSPVASMADINASLNLDMGTF